MPNFVIFMDAGPLGKFPLNRDDCQTVVNLLAGQTEPLSIIAKQFLETTAKALINSEPGPVNDKAATAAALILKAEESTMVEKHMPPR